MNKSTSEVVDSRPDYFNVWLRCVKNSLVRDLSFRSNFLITVVTRGFWFTAQLVLFEIIFRNVADIADWTRAEYFGFMATGMLINAVIESLFMPNCANFSELIRTGNLDFILLKPIDAQFLVSVEKIDFAMMTQGLLALCLLQYSLWELDREISLWNCIMYLLLVGIGVLFFYSLMITLASTSVWFGRNQGLYDFWFYVTVFARYPREIYSGDFVGESIRVLFSFVLPILLVVTVPSRILLDKTLEPSWLMAWAGVSTVLFFVVSRWIFHWSLSRYRSASS